MASNAFTTISEFKKQANLKIVEEFFCVECYGKMA